MRQSQDIVRDESVMPIFASTLTYLIQFGNRDGKENELELNEGRKYQSKF